MFCQNAAPDWYSTKIVGVLWVASVVNFTHGKTHMSQCDTWENVILIHGGRDRQTDFYW